MRCPAPRLAVAISAVLAVSAAAPSLARAEEEVRISILSNQEKIDAGGRELAIYDADVGDRLASWAENASATIVPKKGALEILAGGKTLARASRLILEAKAGVRVGRGIYLGRVELAMDGGGRDRVSAINRLPLETYLLGIVGSEMSPEWPIEALKAQAVAARTYAMQRHMMMRAANKPYDLESSVISQVYKGAERIRPSVIRAVRETRGEVLSFRHGLVEALFHSTCGGRTRSARSAFGRDVPYLVERECKWCRDSTRLKWELSLPLAQLSRRLEGAKLARGRVERFERKEGAQLVDVKEKKGARRITARAAREAIGFSVLYSEAFTAVTKGSTVQIEGKGFGHGAGMCQWGARGMALAGKKHLQILEHYYAGARVKRIY